MRLSGSICLSEIVLVKIICIRAACKKKVFTKRNHENVITQSAEAAEYTDSNFVER